MTPQETALAAPDNVVGTNRRSARAGFRDRAFLSSGIAPLIRGQNRSCEPDQTRHRCYARSDRQGIRIQHTLKRVDTKRLPANVRCPAHSGPSDHGQPVPATYLDHASGPQWRSEGQSVPSTSRLLDVRVAVAGMTMSRQTVAHPFGLSLLNCSLFTSDSNAACISRLRTLNLPKADTVSPPLRRFPPSPGSLNHVQQNQRVRRLAPKTIQRWRTITSYFRTPHLQEVQETLALAQSGIRSRRCPRTQQRS